MPARQRDSTQRHIVRHLLPAQGLGVPCAPGINDRRVTHNMCCVMSRKHSCMTTEPRSSRIFIGASGLVPWHRRASAMTRFPDSPANQRNGMTAAPVGTWGETRRQAVKRIAGVSVKLGVRSESGQFWESSALERSLRSGRLAERPKAGRSHG